MLLTAFIAQYCVGLVISQFQPTSTGYSPQGYQMAFGIFLSLQLLSIAWYYLSMRNRSFS
jgi:hypothetical protein